MKYFKARFAWVIGLIPTLTFGATLPTIGPVYSIKERDAAEFIVARLKEKEKTGELQRIQEEAVKRSMHTLKHPAPVAGITTAQKNSVRYVDPSVTYPQSITDMDGNMIVAAGTTINPLDFQGLSSTLIFFDGRDKRQVKAVRAWMKNRPLRIKPILVAGSWYELSRAWRTQVYYDQHGILVRRFGITSVPAVIRQEGKRLRLEELGVDGL
jgi:conjugal transfer pilus assembly protein TraW